MFHACCARTFAQVVSLHPQVLLVSVVSQLRRVPAAVEYNTSPSYCVLLLVPKVVCQTHASAASKLTALALTALPVESRHARHDAVEDLIKRALASANVQHQCLSQPRCAETMDGLNDAALGRCLV